MPSAQVVESQRTEDFINGIAWCINLNPNVVFLIKMIKNQSCTESLSQLGKSKQSSKGIKSRYGFFIAVFLNHFTTTDSINII